MADDGTLATIERWFRRVWTAATGPDPGPDSKGTPAPGDKAAADEPARPKSTGPMFGVWKTCQHYATPGAIPMATATSRDTIINESPRLPSTGNFGHFVARGRPDKWVAVGFVKDGAIKFTRPEQLRKYDQCRYEGRKFSNDSYPPLTPAGHPGRTRDLDDPAERR